MIADPLLLSAVLIGVMFLFLLSSILDWCVAFSHGYFWNAYL